ncbi:MAG: hypothetical protein NVSMB18_13060 [Acetobacteraceae bacterium]
MTRVLRLTAALLASLAGPAFAQTTAPATPSRPVPPPAAVQSPAAPSAPVRPTAPAAAPTASAPVPATAPPPASSTAASPAARTAPVAAGTAPAVRTAGTKVDVNSATEQQLDSLPGVGPVRAKAIIAGRPWTELKELVSKNALPQSVLDGARDRLALANINSSSAADMAKTLPGIGEVRARAIVNGRPYASPQDLVTKKVLTQGTYDKMKDLVAY